MKGKPGYEHLNENLHLLVEAELPAEIIYGRLLEVCEILNDLLKPMVPISLSIYIASYLIIRSNFLLMCTKLLCNFCPLHHLFINILCINFVISSSSPPKSEFTFFTISTSLSSIYPPLSPVDMMQRYDGTAGGITRILQATATPGALHSQGC